jgi:hypothetical protein
VRVFLESRRRFHTVFWIAGAFLVAGGLLSYGIVLPEVAFAQAPTVLISTVHPGDIIKIYGTLECSCSKAVDRSDVPAAFGPRDWNATFAAFSIRDPSGTIFIDTDSVERVRPGPHDGDYLPGDKAAVYGAVYDQGHGVLALRAQMIAKAPDDTLAKEWPWMLAVAFAGGILVAAVFTDRLLFGSDET